MKKKSPKPSAGNNNLQKASAGREFAPPSYGVNFVDAQTSSNDGVVQGVFASSPEEIVSANPNHSDRLPLVQKKENKTGLPDNLKSGIENLSGYPLDDVKVHYNSEKPAQLQAHAYTQGANIHVAPGQEKHLPHEAWHVVQQKQGRVKPTMQMKGGVKVNDEADLEKEADLMGRKAFEAEIGNYPKNKNTAIEQSNINSAQIGNEVKQLFKINGQHFGIKDLLPLIIEALPKLDKSLQGKLAQKLDKEKVKVKEEDEEISFDSKQKAIDYIREIGNRYQTAVNHKDKVKQTGDDTELAAAVIIGGQINRGKGEHDVEWRMIDRQLAEKLKVTAKIKPGSYTDQELFASWDKIRTDLDDKFENINLSKIISTPPDAFSSSILALAGGPSKFVKGTNTLKLDAANRVRELIKLAGLLGYTPILVFSSKVSCEQCDAVVSAFGIDIIHLED